jgi:hypothetical protein
VNDRRKDLIVTAIFQITIGIDLFANLANQTQKAGKDCPENVPTWLADAVRMINSNCNAMFQSGLHTQPITIWQKYLFQSALQTQQINLLVSRKFEDVPFCPADAFEPINK